MNIRNKPGSNDRLEQLRDGLDLAAVDAALHAGEITRQQAKRLVVAIAIATERANPHIQNHEAHRQMRNIAILQMVLEGATAAAVSEQHGIAAGLVRSHARNAARFLWRALHLEAQLLYADIPASLVAFRKDRDAWLSRIAKYRHEFAGAELLLDPTALSEAKRLFSEAAGLRRRADELIAKAIPIMSEFARRGASYTDIARHVGIEPSAVRYYAQRTDPCRGCNE